MGELNRLLEADNTKMLKEKQLNTELLMVKEDEAQNILAKERALDGECQHLQSIVLQL